MTFRGGDGNSRGLFFARGLCVASNVLSILVPVFNEAPNIANVIRRFYATTFPTEVEWIFIDDCSTDGTTDILKELQRQYGFVLKCHESNQGKGAAIGSGIAAAKGNLIVIQDADFEYDPRDIGRLLEPLIQDQADVVFGSRFRQGSPQVHRTYHYFINRFLTMLSNLLSGIYLTDMETCYKVFRAELLKSMTLTSPRFGFEIEVTAYLAKTKARVFELPVSYAPRTRLQGKKINWKDGVAALFHLVRFNLGTTLNEAFRELPERYRPESTERRHVNDEKQSVTTPRAGGS